MVENDDMPFQPGSKKTKPVMVLQKPVF